MEDNGKQGGLSDPKQQGKKKEDSESNYMSLGMCVGMCFGVALGEWIFDNMAVGLSVGLALGLALGLCVKRKSKIISIGKYRINHWHYKKGGIK